MTDTPRTRLCLYEHCGLVHECRDPSSACICPFCGSDGTGTVSAEPLPGFETVAAKPAERRPWTG